MEKHKYHMVSLIRGIFLSNKWTNKTKTNTETEKRLVVTRGEKGVCVGGGGCEMGKGSQLYGDRWEPDFWW